MKPTEKLINDETLGDPCIGSFDQFYDALQENARVWHNELENDCVFDTWFEGILADHLRPATKEEVETMPSITTKETSQ